MTDADDNHLPAAPDPAEHSHGQPLVGAVLAPGRLRWYQVVYRLAYRLGLTVWQRPSPPPDLIALVEGPDALPAGRALDLGCGTGTDTVYLAGRGWEVTGIDMVPQALTAARRRAAAAGVTPRLLHADVTRLQAVDLGGRYQLILDFGCFHTLPDDQRDAYVTSVSRAAAPRATLLLYGFRRPPKAAPMRAGITTDEVHERFGRAGWDLDHAQRATAQAHGIRVRRADDRFELWRYQLRRTSHP